MNDSANQTLILGGGFVGLFTALHLSKQGYSLPTKLIDKNDRFVFKPLLYDFLSGEMNDLQVCPRYEELLQGSNIEFVQDAVQEIDLHNQTVKLANSSIPYKFLVLALGSTTGYFGIEGAKENTVPFRNREEAIALKTHLQDCLRQAQQTTDPQQRRNLLTVAIVGAGPSGVELAATLGDVVPQWYSELGGDVGEIRLFLINRGSQILAGDINEGLREAAETALKERTVPIEVLLNASVTKVQPQQLEYERNEQQETLDAATMIWTTGTTLNPLIKSLPIAKDYRDKKGRLKVVSSLQLLNYPEVFVGGDCAANWHAPLPPLAQVAYQQGAAIAQNLQALAQGKPPNLAQVNLLGSMLKLGLGEGGANLFERLIVTGKPAHLMRQSRYLTTLPTPVHNFVAASEWLSENVFQDFLELDKQSNQLGGVN